MRWPVWLPTPLAWFRTFALFALIALVGLVGRVLMFWGVIASAILQNWILLGTTVALTVAIMVGLVAHTHHWIKGPEGKRHPTLRSWIEGIIAVGVAGGSFCLTVACALPFVPEIQDLPARSAANLLGFLWFVWAAYLYQLESFIFRKCFAKAESPSLD